MGRRGVRRVGCLVHTSCGRRGAKEEEWISSWCCRYGREQIAKCNGHLVGGVHVHALRDQPLHGVEVISTLPIARLDQLVRLCHRGAEDQRPEIRLQYRIFSRSSEPYRPDEFARNEAGGLVRQPLVRDAGVLDQPAE